LAGLFGAVRGAALTADIAPAEVKSIFFTGGPFTATSPSDTKFKMTFTPDGKIAREPLEVLGTMGTERKRLLQPLGLGLSPIVSSLIQLAKTNVHPCIRTKNPS
jgi:hypothetical protein